MEPSFSSSLLEAVYRSMDQSDGRSPALSLPSPSKMQNNPKEKNWLLQTPTPEYICRPGNRAQDRGRRRILSTSSSSECSSFGGFSSSDADSITRPRPVLTRCTGVRSDPPSERKRPSSIRSRLRSLGNPASPRNRISAFLNAIFSGGAGNPKMPRFAGGENESDTSSVRSFVSKTPTSSREGRELSVRFAPVSIASLEGGQQTRFYGEEQHCSVHPAAVRNSRQMVEELLKRLRMEEDEEDSDCESVSSSELFELDSLSAIGRFSDELPVFGTTDLGAKHTAARGFIL